MPEGHRGGKRKARLIVGGAIAAAVIVLFGLVAAGLLNQASYQQYATHHSREHANYAGEKARQSCAAIAAAQLPKCLSQAHTEAELDQSSYEHDQADLIAQRKAALWAEMMGIAALLGMGLSGVGVALVWITFKATKDGNKTSERIGEAQVRAYLSVAKCNLMFREGRISIQPLLRNSGQSPALKVRWRADVSILSEREGAELRGGKTTERFQRFVYDVPAQGERETLYLDCDDFAFGADEAAAFADSFDVNVGVEIFLTGKDVFDRPISATESFLHVFRQVPPNLKDIEISHSTSIERPEEAELE